MLRNQQMIVVFVAACVAAHGACTQISSAGSLRTYFVGNSLTWDANPFSIQGVASWGGQSMTVGFHIQCGASLETIVSNPSTCIDPVAPYGTWAQALDSAHGHTWDVVSIQTFYDTLPQARASAQFLINQTRGNPANAATRFIIYSAYPGGDSFANGQSNINFGPTWDTAYSPSSTFNRDFFHQLMRELRDDPQNAGVLIDMVPLGEVLYTLDQRLAANPVQGPDNVVISSVSQLYRDPVHMGDAGRYAGALTFYSTLFAQSPVGLPSYNDATTQALAPLIQQTVFDVVSTHPLSGVPEPTVLAVALSGGLLMLRRRCRRA